MIGTFCFFMIHWILWPQYTSMFASIPVHHWNLHVRVSIQSVHKSSAKFFTMLRFSPGHGWAQCRKFFTTGMMPSTLRGVYSFHMFSPCCTSSIKLNQIFFYKTQRVKTKLSKPKYVQRSKAPTCCSSEMHRLKPWQRQHARSFAVLSHSWTGKGLGKGWATCNVSSVHSQPPMMAVKGCKKHHKVINNSFRNRI